MTLNYLDYLPSGGGEDPCPSGITPRQQTYIIQVPHEIIARSVRYVNSSCPLRPLIKNQTSEEATGRKLVPFGSIKD